MKISLLAACMFGCLCIVYGQQKTIVSADDLDFLEQMTGDVIESSRIYPGQKLPDPFGVNNTGGTLVRPGGRDTYPAFWIRDYAMSLETGMMGREDQKHMLLLTASTQCGQTWITGDGGYMIPMGAIADHIRVETGLPIYYPGTYDYEEQGNNPHQYGIFPPYSDQFFFIMMAWYYVESSSDIKILQREINGIKLIDRLELAFRVPPTLDGCDLVFTNEKFFGVDFGFRDAEKITGKLVFPSIMKYGAANQLALMFEKLENKDKAAAYRKIASNIKRAIPRTFMNGDGMLRASTGIGSQADVWSTALAVYTGILEGGDMERACKHLEKAYLSGKLAHKGNVRHIIHGEDFSETTAWEVSVAAVNTYQNGAYWGTPAGWVAYAISKVNPEAAQRLMKEFIDDLRENDYRKGSQYGAPWECFYPPGYFRGPVYLTTVSCPYAAVKKMLDE